MILNTVPREKFNLLRQVEIYPYANFLQEIEFDYKASDSKSRQNNNIYGGVTTDKYNPIWGYSGSNYMSQEWCYD